MAALGLTYGQLAIGANIYKLKFEFTLPAPSRAQLTIVPPRATTYPTTTLGYDPMVVSGQIEVLGSALVAAVSDILGSVDTERKISFLYGGTEHYIYAMGGVVTHQTPFAAQFGGTAHNWLVGFSLSATRSGLYKASDDSVVWGS